MAERVNKVGRMSKDEEKVILALVGKMSTEEIAEKIGRNIDTVSQFIKRTYIPPDKPPEQERVDEVIIRHELRDSEKWKRMKQELTADEIRYFEEEFIKLYSQFKSDVLASEESQIFDAIKLDLLKSRNLIERRKARDEIAALERRRQEFFKSHAEDPTEWTDADREFINLMEKHILDLRSAEQSRTTEFVRLQERYDKLMENLKATRSQRIKDVESSKQSFLGLLKMLQQRDLAAHESRMNGLQKLAADKEYRRLGSERTYEDGMIDRPILCADTVDQPDEE